MTLTIELTPERESQLTAVALQQGLAPAELATRLVTEHLPDNAGVSPVERVRALLARWQEEDHTPRAVGPEPREGETPTRALFRKWEEEDAAMTEAEREAEDRFWEEIEQGLAENRGLRLRRPGL